MTLSAAEAFEIARTTIDLRHDGYCSDIRATIAECILIMRSAGRRDLALATYDAMLWIRGMDRVYSPLSSGLEKQGGGR